MSPGTENQIKGLCFSFVNKYSIFQSFFIAALSPTSGPDQNLIDESRLNPINNFSSTISGFGVSLWRFAHSGVTLTAGINIY